MPDFPMKLSGICLAVLAILDVHDVQFKEVLDGDEQEDTSSADPNSHPGHHDCGNSTSDGEEFQEVAASFVCRSLVNRINPCGFGGSECGTARQHTRSSLEDRRWNR
jgi:hypothetical protein